MTSIDYATGDAVRPEGAGRKVIVHVCNDVGGWGAGFVLAISARWREPETAYQAWYEGRNSNDFELGAIQLVQVDDDIWVANVIGQRDVESIDDEPPIRYEAIEVGLDQLADEADAMDASIHMPRIGCGLAGGSWDRIEPIIERTLIDRGLSVVVYDLP